jgi:hypothetical protein
MAAVEPRSRGQPPTSRHRVETKIVLGIEDGLPPSDSMPNYPGPALDWIASCNLCELSVVLYAPRMTKCMTARGGRAGAMHGSIPRSYIVVLSTHLLRILTAFCCYLAPLIK